ncbi:Squalene epoxidase [Neophaeococcomyces mojaviensis]|uniref:Squalene epoxidase n=1 Tax=Neophaeococcomyces mojaviensis TaxID=3383035 RepID=A0ACC2ZSV7_9EURO|nr:Squalene epoxidase [Knufia sp. JES_112]
MPLILDTPSESSIESVYDIHEERRRLHHDADVVVVGAGVLGSALAVAFADQGRSVILLEKSLKEPDRIVGELLQPGGVQALEKLGLRHCLDDIDAITVKGYGVFYYGKAVEIPYPSNAVEQSEGNEKLNKISKRAEGRSFHHGRFISKLRAAALSHPNITVFETEVTSLVTSNSERTPGIIGVQTLTKKVQQDYFFGSLTVVADGYNSKFRKQYSTVTPISKSKFWGLELHHDSCPLPMPNHGHVILSEVAPILLYQIGSHETRALIDIPENTPSASVAAGGVKNYLTNAVLPNIPSSVRPSFQAAIEAGHLRSMPNSFLPPTVNRTPGLALLGDALNMRHPLTGGGMTVALNDVVLIKSLLSPETVPDLDDATLVLRQLRAFHWQRKNLTAVINILAQALYSLFAADDKQLKYLQRGCFRYFQLGGNCIDGPVGLLAGIIRQPLVLFYHFFSVAFLSIWVMLCEQGVVGALTGWSAVQGVLIFYKACVVLFPYIWAECQS